MSIAAATASAAQSSAVQNNGTSSASGSASTTSGQNALTSLSGNFQDFLGMLMTQLKNQDPSSPMDTNSFTQELVEFSSVEQQINTNTSLTQLISLTQSGEMMQASGMVGKKVELSSTQMPLQNSSGSLSFTAAAAGTDCLRVERRFDLEQGTVPPGLVLRTPEVERPGEGQKDGQGRRDDARNEMPSPHSAVEGRTGRFGAAHGQKRSLASATTVRWGNGWKRKYFRFRRLSTPPDRSQRCDTFQ